MSGADLEQSAGRAVEAALSAGADDAEAWAERSVEREIRVYEGAVESLTDAAASGIGIRSFSDGRWGYAYGTDLSGEGLRKLAEAAAGAAAIADPDEDAGMPDEFGAADVGSLAILQFSAAPRLGVAYLGGADGGVLLEGRADLAAYPVSRLQVEFLDLGLGHVDVVESRREVVVPEKAPAVRAEDLQDPLPKDQSIPFGVGFHDLEGQLLPVQAAVIGDVQTFSDVLEFFDALGLQLG